MQVDPACRLIDVNALYGDPRRLSADRLQRHAFYELVYVIRGQYRVTMLGMTWTCGPGWLFCYKPGQPHRTSFPCVTGQGTPEAILLQWTETGASRPSSYPHAYYDAPQRWRHLLTWLLDLHTSVTADDRRAATRLLPLLLRELKRAATRTQSLVPAVNIYIADHLNEPVRIRDLAAVLGLSRSHFSRNFQKLTGRSPRNYVLRARLEQARSLMADRALTLAEIARRTGFSSPGHFSRQFARQYGMTPRQSRP